MVTNRMAATTSIGFIQSEPARGGSRLSLRSLMSIVWSVAAMPPAPGKQTAAWVSRGGWSVMYDQASLPTAFSRMAQASSPYLPFHSA